MYRWDVSLRYVEPYPRLSQQGGEGHWGGRVILPLSARAFPPPRHSIRHICDTSRCTSTRSPHAYPSSRMDSTRTSVTRYVCLRLFFFLLLWRNLSLLPFPFCLFVFSFDFAPFRVCCVPFLVCCLFLSQNTSSAFCEAYRRRVVVVVVGMVLSG